jgi:copper chaperone CopZ
MKYIFLTLYFVLMPLQPAVAEANTATIEVHVLGLVCDFCARAVEKVFYARPDVKNVSVNLSEKKILVEVSDDSTLDDATIRQLVEDSGYSLESIQRRGSNEG